MRFKVFLSPHEFELVDCFRPFTWGHLRSYLVKHGSKTCFCLNLCLHWISDMQNHFFLNRRNSCSIGDRRMCFFSKKNWCSENKLGGGFKYFLFSPLFGGNYPIWLIFLKWVETTTQFLFRWVGWNNQPPTWRFYQLPEVTFFVTGPTFCRRGGGRFRVRFRFPRGFFRDAKMWVRNEIREEAPHFQ